MPDVGYTSQQLAALYGALAKAQGEIRSQNKEEDIESILKMIRGPLSRNGLCFIQSPGVTEDGVKLVMTLTIGHCDGAYLSSSIQAAIPTDENGFWNEFEETGNWLRRVQLTSIFGLKPW